MSLWRATVQIVSPDLGGVGTNTFHIRVPGTSIDVDASINEIMGWIEQFYTDCSSIYADTTGFLFNGEVVGVGPDEGESKTVDDWTVGGVVAGDSLPPANCIVVGWRTGTGGRMGKGRTFLGPIHVGGLAADGTPSATYLATIRTAAATLIESSDSGDNGAVGVWSQGRPASGGNPAEPAAFRDITGAAVRNVFAVLRSRRD